MSSQELLEAALGLSVDERAKLARDLIASLDGPVEEGVSEAWAAEIARRAEELRSGRVQGIPWTEAEARIAERLRRLPKP